MHNQNVRVIARTNSKRVFKSLGLDRTKLLSKQTTQLKSGRNKKTKWRTKSNSNPIKKDWTISGIRRRSVKFWSKLIVENWWKPI